MEVETDGIFSLFYILKIMNFGFNKDYYKKEAIKIIHQKQGEIISFDYENSLSKIRIKCLNGHVWETTSKNIKRNVWCPYCNVYVNENYCRSVFENIFNTRFIKCKPEWLSVDGARLELDGYCDQLNLAFEYNGKQHYTFVNRYHKTRKDLDKIIFYDREKNRLCKQNKVLLVTIPYAIKIDEIKMYIVNELINLGFNLSEYDTSKEIRMEIKSLDYKLQETKEIALSRGGICISESFIGSKKKMKFICKNNHAFEISYNTLKIGQWCRICQPSAWTKSEKFARLEQEILKRNGKLLSREYITQNHDVKVSCEKNHIFMIKPRYIIQKIMWCPYCSRKGKNKKYIEQA